MSSLSGCKRRSIPALCSQTHVMLEDVWVASIYSAQLVPNKLLHEFPNIRKQRCVLTLICGQILQRGLYKRKTGGPLNIRTKGASKKGRWHRSLWKGSVESCAGNVVERSSINFDGTFKCRLTRRSLTKLFQILLLAHATSHINKRNLC